MFHEIEATYVAGLDGQWQSYEVFMSPVNWGLESGDRFEFNVVPTGERLTAPFEIADGVTIPMGSYRWNRYRFEGGLASKRQFSGQLTWWFGNFYSGKLDEWELSATWGRTRACAGRSVPWVTCSWSTTTTCARPTRSRACGDGPSTRTNSW